LKTPFFNGIVGLGEAIMSWNGKERRRFVRVKFPCEITVKGQNRHTLSSHTENISLGGIRAILGEKLPVASEVSIDIYGLKPEPLTCKGRIVWVFERRMTFSKRAFGFDTGIEFCGVKSEDEKVIKEFIESVLNNNHEK